MDDTREERVFISQQNYWAIHDFAYHNGYKRIYGTKLEALYRLIQRKGKVIGFPQDRIYHNIKVLEYGDGDFIGFVRTGYSKTSFFPCKLKIVLLRALGPVGNSTSKY
ncbi:hypothetical protein LCGC14_1615070 [marine sediment metagenome]|uniref:Uncharacterized protein n=2 Tax=root TaxID=1 RepID=A0A831QMC9_9FLAO|nr:hypothetical protein [Pricia antarctica]